MPSIGQGFKVDQSFKVQARLVRGVIGTVLLNSPSFLSVAVELKTIQVPAKCSVCGVQRGGGGSTGHQHHQGV